jgi:peptidyl-prolyl cis-trans isomerase C
MSDRVCLYGRDMSRPFQHRESPTGIGHYILPTSVMGQADPAEQDPKSAVLKFEKSPADKRVFPTMNFNRSTSRSLFLLILWTLGAWAQSSSPAPQAAQVVSPDEVVVVIDGVEYTARELRVIRNALPPQYKKQTEKMNYDSFVTVYSELLSFAKMAEKEGIPEKEPYKTQLAFARMNFLAQVYLSRLSSLLEVADEDLLNYYEANKSDFEEFKVSAIYIDFATPDAPSAAVGNNKVTEAEATAKAEGIVAELRGGADFAELAKKHSDDTASRDKGGDLGFFTRETSIPEALKDAIFQLKEGEISDPVKDGRRFYVLTVTERRAKPLEKVRSAVNQKVRGTKFKEEIDEIRRAVSIERKNEQFLKQTPHTPLAIKTITIPPLPE